MTAANGELNENRRKTRKLLKAAKQEQSLSTLALIEAMQQDVKMKKKTKEVDGALAQSLGGLG